MSYWDVTGDNLPDLNPEAIFVGGVSGTHRAVQLYFQNDGITPLVAPYNPLITLYGGVEYLATFFAANGSNLGTVGNWTGPNKIDVAANMAGVATHTTNFDFAKLTFALLKGWTYAAARIITAKIQAEKAGELSQNSGNVLSMGLNLSLGTLRGGEDFQVVGDSFYMPQWLNAVPTDQGLIVLQLNTLWTKNTFRTQTADDQGVNGRIIAYSPSPTGKALIWSGWRSAPNPSLTLALSNITSFDADGFPNWGTPVDIDGEGSSGIVNNIPYPHPTLTLNDMPVILAGRLPESAGTGDILVNQGTLANPAYTGFLAMQDIDTNLRSAQHIRYDSQGRAYFAHKAPTAPSPTGFGVARLTFTGTNNNEASLLNVANWTYEEIGFIPIAGSTPPANGNGQTAAYRGRGIAIDESNIVNGEPTIYMTDLTGHVIFQIQHNGGTAGDGTDWDFTIVVGQSGVFGDTEGVGTAALLYQPAGLNIYNGDLYCVEKFGSKVRKIELPGLQTSTTYGLYNVRSHVDQFSY